ncbi:helix-turn-helix domain-containing protein [Bacillus sp. BRMEA1]|uniref:helix-turn-helix domain-containing protein n=1 Tax=Neobacillus endophyticus TaxID=2738405 RepID=UPI0015666801|nr:RodZ domain-containing protein [Neobacillus endophyticus]NRD78909.1 helix-turn-helix domain-containing protein [Neobacillus endophyticus]
MTELGNRLKEARLEKNLSLDDLQSMTKIQKRYLIGIEEGNYSSMPGNFYVRAFIKQYAETLGLNPEEIFETYKSEIPASHNEDVPQLSRVKTQKTISEGNARVFDILPKVLIAVFVIGVAGIFYYFISHHSGSISNQSSKKDNEPVKVITNKVKANETDTADKKDSQNTANQAKKDNPSPPAVQQQVKQEVSVVQSSGRNTTYSVKNTSKFVVKLVSRGTTWVSIKTGSGKSVFQGMLTKGTSESQTADLSAETMAVIKVGNAADTDIYVNDEKLQYAIPPSQSVQNITIQYVPKS